MLSYRLRNRITRLACRYALSTAARQTEVHTLAALLSVARKSPKSESPDEWNRFVNRAQISIHIQPPDPQLKRYSPTKVLRMLNFLAELHKFQPGCKDAASKVASAIAEQLSQRCGGQLNKQDFLELSRILPLLCAAFPHIGETLKTTFTKSIKPTHTRGLGLLQIQYLLSSFYVSRYVDATTHVSLVKECVKCVSSSSMSPDKLLLALQFLQNILVNDSPITINDKAAIKAAMLTALEGYSNSLGSMPSLLRAVKSVPYASCIRIIQFIRSVDNSYHLSLIEAITKKWGALIHECNKKQFRIELLSHLAKLGVAESFFVPLCTGIPTEELFEAILEFNLPIPDALEARALQDLRSFSRRGLHLASLLLRRGLASSKTLFLEYLKAEDSVSGICECLLVAATAVIPQEGVPTTLRDDLFALFLDAVRVIVIKEAHIEACAWTDMLASLLSLWPHRTSDASREAWERLLSVSLTANHFPTVKACAAAIERIAKAVGKCSEVITLDLSTAALSILVDVLLNFASVSGFSINDFLAASEGLLVVHGVQVSSAGRELFQHFMKVAVSINAAHPLELEHASPSQLGAIIRLFNIASVEESAVTPVVQHTISLPQKVWKGSDGFGLFKSCVEARVSEALLNSLCHQAEVIPRALSTTKAVELLSAFAVGKRNNLQIVDELAEKVISSKDLSVSEAICALRAFVELDFTVAEAIGPLLSKIKNGAPALTVEDISCLLSCTKVLSCAADFYPALALRAVELRNNADCSQITVLIEAFASVNQDLLASFGDRVIRSCISRVLHLRQSFTTHETLRLLSALVKGKVAHVTCFSVLLARASEDRTSFTLPDVYELLRLRREARFDTQIEKALSTVCRPLFVASTNQFLSSKARSTLAKNPEKAAFLLKNIAMECPNDPVADAIIKLLVEDVSTINPEMLQAMLDLLSHKIRRDVLVLKKLLAHGVAVVFPVAPPTILPTLLAAFVACEVKSSHLFESFEGRCVRGLWSHFEIPELATIAAVYRDIRRAKAQVADPLLVRVQQCLKNSSCDPSCGQLHKIVTFIHDMALIDRPLSQLLCKFCANKICEFSVLELKEVLSALCRWRLFSVAVLGKEKALQLLPAIRRHLSASMETTNAVVFAWAIARAGVHSEGREVLAQLFGVILDHKSIVNRSGFCEQIWETLSLVGREYAPEIYDALSQSQPS